MDSSRIMCRERMFRQVSNSRDMDCSYQNNLNDIPELMVKGRQKWAAHRSNEQQVSDVSQTSMKSIFPFPELTWTGAGSFGGTSFVTKVRDMFVKAFVRIGGGGAGGAVYVSFWTTLVRGTVLDRENLLLLRPVYRKKKESISELQPTKVITFLQASPPVYY